MKIGIYGKLRSGKSEVCNLYEGMLDDSIILDFGDSLKECVKVAYPFLDYKTKNRELLIKFGQTLREMDKNIWVNALKYKILNCTKKNIIVTGIRQQNEYDMLKELGFVFVKIESDIEKRIERCKQQKDQFEESSLFDSTETELDKFEYDFLIENTRTLKDLSIDALNVLDEIKYLEDYND